MKIKIINELFSVCKVEDYSQININTPFCFIQKTDEENSLVCLTKDIPANVIIQEDHWICMRIEGVLDFNLIGILSKISSILANVGIPIFAISTYNTDYIFISEFNKKIAIDTLSKNGYDFVKEN